MAEGEKILIVDDSSINLEVLSRYLKIFNCKLLFATTGERALEIAQNAIPDLILLDIILPGINGYDVCKQIKANKKLQSIPILFFSTLENVSNKVDAFEAGGVDYISKPFQKEELIARVKTHLELYRIRRENLKYGNEMYKLAEERAKSLIHAERLATLGTLSAGIAHEINNPTTFISVSIQTLVKIWPDIKSVISGETPLQDASTKKLTFAIENIPEMISNIHSGVKRIKKIVNALKTYSHAGKSVKEPCNINKCANDAIELCFNRLKYNIQVEKNFDENIPNVLADPQQIEQVFVNLIVNSADAVEQKGNGYIQISTSHIDNWVSIKVKDNGVGIAPEQMQRIWDPFHTTKSRDKGTGLGLSISKGIIEDHGGNITIQSQLDDGCQFAINLPIKV